ncbi:MAG: hypothetical protein QM723_40540 [Myxococcaceae bacterium]
MKKVLLVVAPVVFVMMATSSTMLATGCGGGGSGGSGGGGGGGGGTDGGLSTTCDSNAASETSTTVYNKIHAACDSCHSNCPNGAGCFYGDYGDATKMYNAMVNHNSIYGALKMVAPNDLAHSTVYLKVGCTPITNPSCTAPDGTNIGAAMPQNGPTALTADQVKAVKDWICKGAPQ